MLPAEMFPFVFGHEGAGVVEAVGADVSGVDVGDHVVLSFRSCRTCARWVSGRVGYCENHLMLNYIGSRLDGSKAYSRDGSPVSGPSSASPALPSTSSRTPTTSSWSTLPSSWLPLLRTAAGTRPVPVQSSTSSPDRRRESLVVFGAGAVGLAAIAALGAPGSTRCSPSTCCRVGSRRPSAWARSVRASTLDKDQVVAGLREATQGGPTFGVETTAVPEVVRQAVDVLGPTGKLVVLGLSMATPEFSVDAVDLLQNGKTVRGSIEGDSDPQVMVPHLIAAKSSGAFDVDGLTQTYAFEDINRAAEEAAAGQVVKPVLVW